MARGLIKTWHTLLDVLFPPICLSCRGYLPSPEEKENLLCAGCFQGIKIYSNIFPPSPRVGLIAVGSYENTALRELIHYFKYNGFLAAKIPIEKLIIKWLEINRSLIPILLLPNSCLIPIPLHRSRLQKRGFNQAEIIAEILSRRLNLPLEKNLLKRTRDTKSQIKMRSTRKREENVKGSIQLSPLKGDNLGALPQCQNVILVDDVYTSGATMQEAIRTLRRTGAKEIIGFVVAKT